MHPSAECGATYSSVTFHLAFNDRGEGAIKRAGMAGRCVQGGSFVRGYRVCPWGVCPGKIYLPSRAATGRADKNDTGGG